jgi:hypothetical protein
MTGNVILVGDVGGTHARFAIVDVSGLGALRIKHRLDLEQQFPTFSGAAHLYRALRPVERSGIDSHRGSRPRNSRTGAFHESTVGDLGGCAERFRLQ